MCERVREREREREREDDSGLGGLRGRRRNDGAAVL
jgi:hypothetical protein